MKGHFLVALFSYFISSESALAKVTGIQVWSSSNGKIQLLLPTLQGRSSIGIPRVFEKSLRASRYATVKDSELNQTPGLFKDFSRETVPFQAQANEVPLALVANRPGLMLSTDPRAQITVNAFEEAGAKVYVVPFGADTFLSPSELAEFHLIIAKSFAVLVAPGGVDLNPKLYGQKLTYADSWGDPRDEVELRLVKKYLEIAKGIFFGICRGHQAYAVSQGGTLFQDLKLISQEVDRLHHVPSPPKTGFPNTWHPVQLVDTQNALFEAVQQKEFRVNSRHHQAVQKLPRKAGRVIAKTGQVIESVEKRDSKGEVRVLTTQFHPEDMETPEGKKILRWVVNQGKKFIAQAKQVG